MRETLNIILNECEGSITVVRGDGKKIKVMNDGGRSGITRSDDEGSLP